MTNEADAEFRGWPLIAGGVALGVGLAVARKLLVQAPTALADDWVGGLEGEHVAVRNLLRVLKRTEKSDRKRRLYLLHKIRTALTRHAIQEENVIYPALREAGQIEAVDLLTSEHGDIKFRLYRLEALIEEGAGFEPALDEFMTDLFEHMAREEEDLFPLLRSMLGDEGSARLGARVNLQGLQFA
jgi:hemerythrin superfamily protein